MGHKRTKLSSAYEATKIRIEDHLESANETITKFRENIEVAEQGQGLIEEKVEQEE